VLDGGAGNDVLNGNGGRDLLIGGTAADVLNAGHGDDILIAGSLVNYGDYLGALCQIMDEWTSTDSFSTRISALLSTSGGINLLAHIQSDGATDTLNGGSGSDWFLANIVASSADTVLDKIMNFNANVDFKTDI
jgi:Ca2+-binding RTX toxin-like protein